MLRSGERATMAGKLVAGQMDEVVRRDKAGEYELGWMMTSEVHDVVCRANYRNTHAGVTDEWDDPLKDMISAKFDTIGYVPNAVIRTAFEAKQYDEFMRLFEETYVFIRITGPQWRALKAAGIE